jgi:protein-disulfide isomerase
LRWAAIIGVVVFVAGSLFVFSVIGGADDPAEVGDVSSANSQGPANAPVNVVEFGDFGCPSCRA